MLLDLTLPTMHELSIAINIVELCDEEIQKNKLLGIQNILIEIGELSGVELYALEYALREAINGSTFSNAEFQFQIQKGIAKCTHCQKSYSITHIYDPCPECGNHKSDIVQGKEIKIKSIEAY